MFRLALVWIFCACLFRPAYEKDMEPDLGKRMVGTWQATGHRTGDSGEWEGYGAVRMYTFKANGKGFYRYDRNNPVNITYSILGEVLDIRHGDGDEALYIIESLTSSRMVWRTGGYEIEWTKRQPN